MFQRPFPLLLPALLILTAPARADETPSGSAANPAAIAAPAKDADDLARQLADTQDKLSTALHSYSLLQDENAQLKADAEKSAADKSALEGQVAQANNANGALRSQAAVATQVDGLREQLRQAQNEIAALATENAGFRTRLALMNSIPAGSQAPYRPSAEGASRVVAPPGGAKTDSLAKTDAAATPDGGIQPDATAKADSSPKMDSGAKADETKAGPRIHIVVEGDSLSKIAKKYYGNANRWNEILAANRGVIKNENNLPVGAKLKIP